MFEKLEKGIRKAQEMKETERVACEAYTPIDGEERAGYSVIEPKLLQGKCKNIHIFEVTLECRDNKYVVTDMDQESCCGKRHLNNKKEAIKHLKGKNLHTASMKKLRSYAADAQNKGDEICGTCVSTLYADPEEDEK